MTQTLIRKVVTGEVVVEGSKRTLVSADVTLGTDIQVAQGTVVVDPRAGLVYGNEEIVVRVAVAGAYKEVLTGIVVGESIAMVPRGLSFNVLGVLDRARHEIGVPAIPGEEELDPEGNPLPIQVWVGVDDGQIIKDLLDLSNVPYNDDDIASAGVELGTVAPITLGQSETPFSKIVAIDEALGMRTFELGDGSVRRIPWTGLPPSGGIVLQQGVNFQVADRTISVDQMFNRITVTGATTIEGAPHTTIDAESKINPLTGRPYITTPPQFRATSYSSPILETYDLVVAYGTRFLGQHNRLQETMQGRTLPPNPAIVPGTGAVVISPNLNVDSGSAYRIQSFHLQLGPSGLQTDVTLAGGYASEGVDTNEMPVPSFTITVVREHIAGQGDIYVIVADGSSSYDPGSVFTQPDTLDQFGNVVPGFEFNGIFRYQWTSSLGVSPNILGKGERATWTVDFNPTGETITLTVFDAQLASKSLTKPITTGQASNVLVRDLWLAVQTELLYTNDGERTWQVVDIPSVFVPEQAADTFTIAIDTGGQAHKVLTDLTHTPLVGPPASATCASIRYKFPDTKVEGDRCWLGMADGAIWFSGDKGETWELRGTIPGGTAVIDISESAYSEGDIYATARNVLFHSYDAGVSWQPFYTHPNAALVATKVAAGFEDMFVAFRGTPPATNPQNEESRIRERGNNKAGDWYRSSTGQGLQAGAYLTAYSYRGASGETLLSPTKSVVVTEGQVIVFPIFTPLPAGATGIHYYVSLVAGGTALGRAGTDTGDSVFAVLATPDGAQLAPTTNTTAPLLANPATQPATAAGPPPLATVDFPAQPAAITMAVYREDLAAVGLAVDGAAHSWYADASSDFTFERGHYPGDQFGPPADIYRDGFIENVVYVLGRDAFGKTTTFFKGDCFRVLALTGGRVGRRLGYGKIGPAPLPKGDLVWSAWDGTNWSDNFQGPPNAVVMALTDEGFVKRCDPHPLNGMRARTLPIVAPGGGALLTYSRLGGGADTSKYLPGGDNNFYRSVDGGATWTQITSPSKVAYVTHDYNGTCWCIAHGPNPANQEGLIYKSVDFGATWDLVYNWGAQKGISSNSGMAPSQILPSPTDPNVIFLRHNGYYKSTDGGASFPGDVFIPAFDYAGFGSGGHGTFSPDGQWLVFKTGNAGANYWYRSSVVSGGAGTLALDGFPGELTQPSFLKDGRIYVYGIGGVYYSEDQGVSWLPAYTAANQPAVENPAQLSQNPQVSGFVAGDQTNTWHTLSASTFKTAYITKAPASVTPLAGRWESLHEELLAFDGTREYRCLPEGATRIIGGAGE